MKISVLYALVKLIRRAFRQMAVKMITPIYIEVTCNATANIVEFK